MDASFLQVVILAVIQGLAELLPVSSSAHVIVAEKLMGLNPSAPAMTFLLVMLHTGTMFAVILYFWPKWRTLLKGDQGSGRIFLKHAAIATVGTVIVGFGLKFAIEKTLLRDAPKAEIEELFSNLPLIAASLAAAAALILTASWRGGKQRAAEQGLTPRSAGIIGIVQGLCLPFRGFSRSGATISTGMLQGVSRDLAETFSFTLALILTPPVLGRELLRLMKATKESGGTALDAAIFMPGLAGMVFSFIAGLVALRWLSSWLEHGRWQYFGFYCLAASATVLVVHYGVTGG